MADEIVHFWRNLKPPGRFLTRCNSDEVEEDDDLGEGRGEEVGEGRGEGGERGGDGQNPAFTSNQN